MDIFLKELEESLRGEVPESVVRDTVSYYRNYFASQKADGVTEEAVIASLGSGRMIARSVIEANRTDSRETVYTSEPRQNEETKSSKGDGLFARLKIIAIIMAVTIVVLFVAGLFFRLLWMLLPVILIIMLIVWLVKQL